MLSLGIPASRPWSIAVRRRGLPSGSPPPSLAATAISRASLLNSLPRTRSTFCFFSRILCHFEWQDMPPPRLLHSITRSYSEGGAPRQRKHFYSVIARHEVPKQSPVRR